ncbi:MAG TPA: 50S ribosomal protein L4 [Cyclobacteriaceae bacterium]|jgi:large subunit ribosomal protein L4
MNLSVYTHSGSDTGRKISLVKEIFGAEPNDHAIYLDVKQFLANQRQGTHKSKQRNEVSGSTRKLRKQKGSGAARVGSIKSPLFRGGGRVFGPQPRDYSFKLNKKLKKLARISALSYKAKDKAITVVEDFTFDEVKTRNYVNMLNSLSLGDKKTLLVMPKSDKNVILAGRNIKKAAITTADNLNTYDVLNADNLLVIESSLDRIKELLK